MKSSCEKNGVAESDWVWHQHSPILKLCLWPSLEEHPSVVDSTTEQKQAKKSTSGREPGCCFCCTVKFTVYSQQKHQISPNSQHFLHKKARVWTQSQPIGWEKCRVYAGIKLHIFLVYHKSVRNVYKRNKCVETYERAAFSLPIKLFALFLLWTTVMSDFELYSFCNWVLDTNLYRKNWGWGNDITWRERFLKKLHLR